MSEHEHKWTVGIAAGEGGGIIASCFLCGEDHTLATEDALSMIFYGLAWKRLAQEARRYATDMVSMDARGRLAAHDRFQEALSNLPFEAW